MSLLKGNIRVHPIKDKELYRIFKDLEKYGRTTFNYPDRGKQQSIARKIGVNGKKLIEKNLLLPPAKTRTSRINIIAIPPNVICKEKKKGIFNFLRGKP
jgi:hypothetical protein